MLNHLVLVGTFVEKCIVTAKEAWHTTTAGGGAKLPAHRKLLHRRSAMKSIGIVLLLVTLSSWAFAGGEPVPEVGPATCVAALAMLSGALLVIRGRRKKQSKGGR